MAGPGGGPSRRSHTKSRKGCKTCKKRHIRCDETYPACRNCIKHNCLCDYLETASSVSSTESFHAPFSVPDLVWTPEVEATILHWQKTGVCSMGDVHIDLSDLDQTYTRNDLLLLYHCLKAGQGAETNTYTVWTGLTPRFLSIASQHPFLLHAILSFGGASLAFESQASDAKSLAYHHGGIALKGLQNAITNFSKENADAVLGASILLSWQANDWRSWASLITGIRTVVTSMRTWKDESMIPDLIIEQELSIPDSFPSLTRTPTSDDFSLEYDSTLQQVFGAFENLQQYFYERDEESKWIDQLKDYFQRLRQVRPAHTPEEQFNHLYAFRKWIFWVPSTCLRSENRDYMTLVLLAYLYSSALSVEALYPNIAPAFCSLAVQRPLEEIIKAFTSLQAQSYTDHRVQDMLHLMEYPKRVFADYQARQLDFDFSLMNPRRSPAGLDRLNLDLTKYIENYGDAGHYSPAFMPSPVAHARHDSGPLVSEHGSPYLDIPDNRLSGHFSNSSFGSPYMSAGGYHEEAFFRTPDTPVSGFVAQQFLWT